MKLKDNGPSPGPGGGEKNDREPVKPGKPGSDPDQTPQREVNDPPVADPAKVQDPKQPSKPAYK